MRSLSLPPHLYLSHLGRGEIVEWSGKEVSFYTQESGAINTRPLCLPTQVYGTLHTGGTALIPSKLYLGLLDTHDDFGGRTI